MNEYLQAFLLVLALSVFGLLYVNSLCSMAGESKLGKTPIRLKPSHVAIKRHYRKTNKFKRPNKPTKRQSL